jgi:hypothetical protein
MDYKLLVKSILCGITAALLVVALAVATVMILNTLDFKLAGIIVLVLAFIGTISTSVSYIYYTKHRGSKND